MNTALLGLTAEIIAAHVVHNHVAVDALPIMIQSVYRALANVGVPDAAPAERAPTPAVPVKRSVFPDYIVCLEDGKKLKMLKRHLKTSYDMSPADYRARWGLPLDYPMVAPTYASTRSTLAKSIGLGRKRSAVQSDADQVQPAEPKPVADEPEVTKGKARRGRGSRG